MSQVLISQVTMILTIIIQVLPPKTLTTPFQLSRGIIQYTHLALHHVRQYRFPICRRC